MNWRFVAHEVLTASILLKLTLLLGTLQPVQLEQRGILLALLTLTLRAEDNHDSLVERRAPSKAVAACGASLDVSEVLRPITQVI